jgi:hypothetical protein
VAVYEKSGRRLSKIQLLFLNYLMTVFKKTWLLFMKNLVGVCKLSGDYL